MEHAAAHEGADGQGGPTLYVVATPIGNLRDITLRALDVLKSVDAVAAEDTRVTARLLGHYGIAKRLISVREHNERRAIKEVLALLSAGKSLALVSDAGTPGVSDPGAVVAGAAREAGYAVTPIPGPNAAVTALSAAGFEAPHFLFYGFLPSRAAERRRALARLAPLPFPLVFHEAPHRIMTAWPTCARRWAASAISSSRASSRSSSNRYTVVRSRKPAHGWRPIRTGSAGNSC